MPERAYPRFDLVAQVELTHGDGEVIILTAQNASPGGLFLLGNPMDHPALKVGSMVSVHICQIQEVPTESAAMTDEELVVNGTGKITRIEITELRSGFAVQFTKLDDENKKRLVELSKQKRR